MMTMRFAGPMPFLEYPLRIPGTDSSHDAFVCLDRRIVGARRVGAVQAVMMTANALGDLSVAEQMPILDHQLPVKCCAWPRWRNYSVKMPISHTSANVCCIHDEDVRREVRLETRRWLTMEASEPGPANESGGNDSVDTVRGRQQHRIFYDWHRAIATPSNLCCASQVACGVGNGFTRVWRVVIAS